MHTEGSWKSLLITGTPGTGKSTLAAVLSEKLNIPVFNMRREAEKHGLVEGYDAERDALIIPEEAVEEILKRLEAEHDRLILEGHLAHYAKPQAWRRLVVLEAPLPLLKRRLEERGYPERKVRENLDAEIFKVCRMEAIEHGWQPIILTSDTPVEALVEKIIVWLREE